MITNSGNFRITIQETNLIPQIQVPAIRKAAFVIDSEMGPDYPYLVNNVNDLLRLYGIPTNNRLGVLEVLPYLANYPAYIVRAVHPDASYAGVDVTDTEVIPFGKGSNRTTISASNYTSIKRGVRFLVANSDGATASYNGTFPYSDPSSSYVTGSAELYINGNKVNLTPTSPTSYSFGTSNNSTLSFTGTNNSYQIIFDGSPGSPAELDTSALTNGVDLSSGLSLGSDIGFNLYIDDIVVLNLTLSAGSYTDGTAVANALNTVFQNAIGSSSFSPFSIVSSGGAEYLKITGLKASSSIGKVQVTPPSDFTLTSAIPFLFDSSVPTPTSISQTTNATDPTGDIPLFGTPIELFVNYIDTNNNDISHSFYAFSKYNDDFYNLAVKINQNPDNTFNLTLYKYENGNYIELSNYLYSLDPNAKDQFGFSIYIMDVFKNNEYIVPVINPNFTGTMNLTTYTSPVRLSGGSSGSAITVTDLENAWNKLHDKKYTSHLLVDFYGGFAQKLKTLIEEVHFYAFGITRVPNGINPSNAVLYAKSLPKMDNVALYFNRVKVVHPYTQNEVYVTALGDLAVRFMEMEPDFDGFSPAFVDKDNGYGGQLRYFTPIEIEYELTESQKEALDNARVNPLVLDETYGLMAYGDRTLDPNVYINERRVTSNLIEKIVKNVLNKTIGALNTPVLRKRVEVEINEILSDALASGVITDPVVQCDDINNAEELKKGGRKLIVDVFIKVPPSIQRIHLRFTRSSSTISVQQ